MNDRVTLSSSDDTEGLADDLRDELRARGLPASVTHVREPRPGTLGAAEHIELGVAGLGVLSALVAALAPRLKRPSFRVHLKVGDNEADLTAESAADRAELREIVDKLFDQPGDQPGDRP